MRQRQMCNLQCRKTTVFHGDGIYKDIAFIIINYITYRDKIKRYDLLRLLDVDKSN